MTLYDGMFWFFAVMTLIPAGIVVFSRNIVHAAFALLFAFFGVAGLYVLLSADLIAVAQIMIYVGGILVLLLFGVMLTNKVVSVDIRTGTLQTLPASMIVSATAGSLCGVFWITDWPAVRGGEPPQATASALGEMFMTSYLLPFEIASVVLLVALIGAAMIARRDREGGA